MTKRDGIFAGDDPFAITKRWYEEAAESEPNDPGAAALASVDDAGVPNVRMVLVRGFDPDGLIFYTNYGSPKAQELDQAGKAALVFHWKTLRRQVRIRGDVEREEGAVADAYYAARPLGSRIGAWASEQSTEIADRAALEAQVAAAEARWGDAPPRPEFWGGFRVRPTSFEFWADGEFRLHDRFYWTADGDGSWRIARLSP